MWKPHMGLPRLLFYVWLGILSLAFVVEQAANLHELLGMNTPPWFWNVMLSGLFVLTVIGMLIVQDRKIAVLEGAVDVLKAQRLPTDETRTKREIFLDKVNDAIRRGADIVTALSTITGSQATHELKTAVEKWADSTYYLLNPQYPGVAAFLHSELPDTNRRYDKNPLTRYMNGRLVDLQKLMEQGIDKQSLG